MEHHEDRVIDAVAVAEMVPAKAGVAPLTVEADRRTAVAICQLAETVWNVLLVMLRSIIFKPSHDRLMAVRFPDLGICRAPLLQYLPPVSGAIRDIADLFVSRGETNKHVSL